MKSGNGSSNGSIAENWHVCLSRRPLVPLLCNCSKILSGRCVLSTNAEFLVRHSDLVSILCTEVLHVGQANIQI